MANSDLFQSRFLATFHHIQPIRQRIFDTINRLQENQLTLFNPEDFKKLKK